MTEKEAKDILGVVKGQPAEEVRRSYLKLLKKARPETDPEGFQRLREAWELLQNRQANRPRTVPSPPRTKTTAKAPLWMGPGELLRKSRTGLSSEERTQLVAQLESDRNPPLEVLMAAINTVLLEFDPSHPEIGGPLGERVSLTLSKASVIGPDLLVKWSYTHQLFQVGPSLAPAALTALRTILLYFDASEAMPVESRDQLEGVTDPSVAQLYRLAEPTLAVYLDSRADVQALRSKSLKDEFRRTVSSHLPKSNAWMGWVALLLVLGLVRALMGDGNSAQERLNQAHAALASKIPAAPLFPDPAFPTNEALEALSEPELVELGQSLKAKIQGYQRAISGVQGRSPPRPGQERTLARLTAEQTLLRDQLKQLNAIRESRLAPKP